MSAPGLNSIYGLYFEIGLAGAFPIRASGTVIAPATYASLNVQLAADLGHDDGSLVDDAAGIGFSNAAGVSNDVVLATASLVSASLGLNPATGLRSAHPCQRLDGVERGGRQRHCHRCRATCGRAGLDRAVRRGPAHS